MCLYLEMDVSGIGFGAGLLQVIEGINCEHDEIPDNATLCPATFASKRLSSAEWQYSNKQWETLAKLHVPKYVITTVLLRRYM